MNIIEKMPNGSIGEGVQTFDRIVEEEFAKLKLNTGDKKLQIKKSVWSEEMSLASDINGYEFTIRRGWWVFGQPLATIETPMQWTTGGMTRYIPEITASAFAPEALPLLKTIGERYEAELSDGKFTIQKKFN